MTQEQCLQTPSHYTRYGTCYVGSQVTIQLHGITVGGSSAPTSVPEPSTFALCAVALAVGVLFLARQATSDQLWGRFRSN